MIYLNQVYCFGGTCYFAFSEKRQPVIGVWVLTVNSVWQISILLELFFFPFSEHSSPRSTREHYPTIVPGSTFFLCAQRHLVYVGYTTMFITKDCFHFQGFFLTFQSAKNLVRQWWSHLRRVKVFLEQDYANTYYMAELTNWMLILKSFINRIVFFHYLT